MIRGDEMRKFRAKFRHKTINGTDVYGLTMTNATDTATGKRHVGTMVTGLKKYQERCMVCGETLFSDYANMIEVCMNSGDIMFLAHPECAKAFGRLLQKGPTT